MIKTMTGKWYVIRVAGNKERSLAEKIRSEVIANGFEKNVYDIVVPVEKKFSMRNGKKVSREVVLYPSYVLINTDNINEIKNMLKGIMYISGIISDRSGNPTSLTQSDANTMLGKIEELKESAIIATSAYIIGEKVKIVDGPFSGFFGTIELMDPDKEKLKVEVTIFGRKTPVELSEMQVIKHN